MLKAENQKRGERQCQAWLIKGLRQPIRRESSCCSGLEKREKKKQKRLQRACVLIAAGRLSREDENQSFPGFSGVWNAPLKGNKTLRPTHEKRRSFKTAAAQEGRQASSKRRLPPIFFYLTLFIDYYINKMSASGPSPPNCVWWLGTALYAVYLLFYLMLADDSNLTKIRKAKGCEEAVPGFSFHPSLLFYCYWQDFLII